MFSHDAKKAGGFDLNCRGSGRGHFPHLQIGHLNFSFLLESVGNIVVSQ